MIFFSWAESERRSFSGNTWKHDALPSEEKQETRYIGLKFGFSLNLFGWRYSTMNNLQYFVPFSPQELCLGACLSANKGNHLSIRGQVVIHKMQEQRQKLFSVEVEQTFLKVHAKNLMKVTGIGEVKGRKGPPTLRKQKHGRHQTGKIYRGTNFEVKRKI